LALEEYKILQSGKLTVELFDKLEEKGIIVTDANFNSLADSLRVKKLLIIRHSNIT